ncbi:hypothetical protein [Legionella sainthelensi]|nr:hypothetical protein [Legionella sainthelensi]
MVQSDVLLENIEAILKSCNNITVVVDDMKKLPQIIQSGFQ